MASTTPRNRYVLVPRPAGRSTPDAPRVKRYSLGRIAPSPRSALGEDRHERLERAARSGRPDEPAR